MSEYVPSGIEPRWQARWDEARTFRAREDSPRPKMYVLEMLPYPSGEIHMGHIRNYTMGDVFARFWRMRGREVLHPMGWDALGLPAENAAIQRRTHPRDWTLANIRRMRDQLRAMGFSYDWEREIASCDPEYYRWNQWMFLRMMERGLVYRKNRPVNWCPSCATVLANEQVHDGRCWRCKSEVEARSLEQWFLRITDYADEILRGLPALRGWPERVTAMQENWIGRSEGARIAFPVEGMPAESVPVFTTRVDTIFGCTFVVIAPDHPLLDRIVTDPGRRETLRAFARRAGAKAILDRGETVEKDGIPTGVVLVNPFNGKPVQLWAANFVVADYGTGAVMSVPAHDTRDHEFATKYGIPIVTVIEPPPGAPPAPPGSAYTDYGILRDSGEFSGMTSEEAIPRMIARGAAAGFARPHTDWRLKDWSVSRQRYWGTPIPIVYCASCGTVPVPDLDLPVRIPDEWVQEGEGAPLSRIASFVATSCPKCGGEARRDVETMDTFVDSSWYFLRYCDPRWDRAPFRKEIAGHWMPVDLYIGGIEHATMHLIYFRFWTMALRDLGLLDRGEPVVNLLCQGMVTLGGSAMSKSRGNVVEPGPLVARYGADALRLFMMFAAPPEKDLEWSDAGIDGAWRFLQRVWRAADRLLDGTAPRGPARDAAGCEALRRRTHRTIAKVTADIADRMQLNTAVAALMELVNAIHAYAPVEEPLPAPPAQGPDPYREAIEALVLLLAPYAPHCAEELGERLGRQGLVAEAAWPEAEPSLLAEDTVEIVVQVNGKVRGHVTVPREATGEALVAAARADPRVAEWIAGKEIAKTVAVPGRLVNFVVRG